jgi:hypothetical protein
MEVKNFTQLEEFLFKKKQRFVDLFLWQLNSEGIVNRQNSVGLHNDIQACVHSLEGNYRAFDNAKYSIDNYIKICNQNLIPDEYLTWLDKRNLRQCNFAWLYLKNKGYLNKIALDTINNNSDKHYIIIRALDMLFEKMPLKINIIKDIRVAWVQTINYKGWRHDWLDMHNESQCQKAVDFITKKVSVKSSPYTKPPLADDGNELTNYYKFLASVDTWQEFPLNKQTFYKKITGSSRKWVTPEQKKAQVKLKRKAKENNHLLLKDKKSLEILKSIQEKMKHKTPEETLKYIINEQAKQTDFVEIYEASPNKACKNEFQKDEVITLNDKEDANQPLKVQLNGKQELSDNLEEPNKIEVSNASMNDKVRELIKKNNPF